jgi:hypothetical protein
VEDYPGRIYASSFDILAPARRFVEDSYYLHVFSIPSMEVESLEAIHEFPPSREGMEHALRQLVYTTESRAGHGADDPRLPQLSLSLVSRTIHDLMYEPVILLEGSPAKGTTPSELLGNIADGAPDFVGGATLAMTLIGNSPWLVLAIPAGVILFKVSREVGAALGEVAGDWIRQLKPSRRDSA